MSSQYLPANDGPRGRGSRRFPSRRTTRKWYFYKKTKFLLFFVSFFVILSLYFFYFTPTFVLATPSWVYIPLRPERRNYYSYLILTLIIARILQVLRGDHNDTWKHAMTMPLFPISSTTFCQPFFTFVARASFIVTRFHFELGFALISFIYSPIPLV